MSKAADYIPLRDLLRHNHEERVQGYLKVLNQEEEELEKAKEAKKLQMLQAMKPQGEAEHKVTQPVPTQGTGRQTKFLTVRIEDGAANGHISKLDDVS